jgi:hypothetical protein
MFMRGQLFFGRRHNHDAYAIQRARRIDLARACLDSFGLGTQDQSALAAGHGQINFSQNSRIEQRAVIFAMRIVDRVALAQRVQTIALPGVHLPRQGQRVEHLTQVGNALRECHAREFRIQERHVEGRIVNDEFSVFDEFQELAVDLQKRRLLRQAFSRQPVHLLSALIDVALGIQVLMKFSPRQAAVDQLDAADLDDAMVLFDFETRGLCVQHDLTHYSLLTLGQHFVDRNVGQLIDVFIAFMTGMTLHPNPFDVLRRHGQIQFLP